MVHRLAGFCLSRTSSGIIATVLLHLGVVGSLLYADSGQATAAAATVMITLVDSAGESHMQASRKQSEPKRADPSPSKPPSPAPTSHAIPEETTATAESDRLPVAEETPAAAASITLPRFSADYLNNPPPLYPLISRRLGEKGRVVLRVLVADRDTRYQLVADVMAEANRVRFERVGLVTDPGKPN